ncbi:SIMPL domain-containing protein [Candidatus Uhrbacteria bacterium]|nr:SIMPL domain-containing protein [Candidatus Uhrbacteria bacterium]
MPKLNVLQSRQPWWRGEEIHMLAVLVLSALFFYFGALAILTLKEADRVGKAEVFRDTISISGKGVVTVTPDTAVLLAGLETTAPTVAAAQKENTEKMNAFLARARALGITDADRKITRYSIYPTYEYREENDEEKQVKVGDTVMQEVQLKVRDRQSLGSLMAALGEFSLNQVGSLSFILDDEELVKKQALAEAIRDARRKAEIIATTAGVKMGAIVSLYENESPSFYPEPFTGGEAMMGAEDAEMVPEPQVGTQDVTASVTIMVELK